ncbi:MAG: orotidine-5'-phosphate decarboxylase, partial [Candidatus Levybacteria bacterium]|nr:orotidine-5'-phosphate decarboxylase [Candidatus Levybacteria bacterium]
MIFRDKLETIIAKNNSLLCVGLDPDLTKLPKHLLAAKDPIFEFNKAIVDATHDLVCVYKPNIAFYEAEGIDGLRQLKLTVDYIQNEYSGIPILLDAKRGDIGNTAEKYAKAVFEFWNADAVTVFPHLGLDSLTPFFEYKDKMTIVLIKTSNPDSGMFQDLTVDGEPYYLRVAEK